jgi:hypothetical protein
MSYRKTAKKTASLALPATLGLVAVLTCGPPRAEARNYDLLQGLGSVFAAEDICGFGYNQDAIGAFMAAHVPAEDMSFATDMHNSAEMMHSSMQGSSASEKTAYCAQMAHVAQHYGFLK